MSINASDAPESTLAANSGSEHTPTLADTARLFEGPFGIRSISLTGLFVLACFHTLYFARDFFLPVTVAIVLMFLLTPLIRTLKRLGIPEGLVLLCYKGNKMK
jgi:hypothetical protein